MTNPLADSRTERDALGVLRELFPASVALAIAGTGDEGSAIFPEEESCVSAAVPSRQREFRTGRRCAHAALAKLGLSPVPILVGARRAPCWPPGVVGSITHCPGFIGAAVARATDLRALGLDAELATALPRELVPYVCRPAEIDLLAHASTPGAGDLSKLIFSAKEAVHKCVSNSSATMLDFLDVSIMARPDGSFVTTLHQVDYEGERDFAAIVGRYRFAGLHVFTAAFIPAIG